MSKRVRSLSFCNCENCPVLRKLLIKASFPTRQCISCNWLDDADFLNRCKQCGGDLCESCSIKGQLYDPVKLFQSYCAQCYKTLKCQISINNTKPYCTSYSSLESSESEEEDTSNSQAEAESINETWWYAVAVGREGPKIYESWSDCEPNVLCFSGAKFKKFELRTDAEAFILKHKVVPINNKIKL